MIGWLSGTLRAKHPPRLLLDVHGVGYELEAPMTTFYELPELGAALALHTHQVVREDAVALYGFSREAERDLFRTLIRITGVGPKLALAILSGMDGMRFARCIQEGDGASLARVPGIGKKTAERLIVELRDRLPHLDPGSAAPSTASAGGTFSAAAEPRAEAESALVALGYRPQEAAQMLRHVAREGMSSEALIRAALQTLVART